MAAAAANSSVERVREGGSSRRRRRRIEGVVAYRPNERRESKTNPWPGLRQNEAEQKLVRLMETLWTSFNDVQPFVRNHSGPPQQIRSYCSLLRRRRVCVCVCGEPATFCSASLPAVSSFFACLLGFSWQSSSDGMFGSENPEPSFEEMWFGNPTHAFLNDSQLNCRFDSYSDTAQFYPLVTFAILLPTTHTTFEEKVAFDAIGNF